MEVTLSERDVPSISINNMLKQDQEFIGAGICASKYGWLLLQRSHKTCFYNPFSKKAIKLPDMDISFNRATFSSTPTSPDCICFAIESSKSSDKILIRTCHPGDQEWRKITLNGFETVVDDVVYVNGRFYCVFSGGILGAFCVKDSKWTILSRRRWDHFTEFRSQLVESNGELLRICNNSSCFLVFKFDWLNKAWMAMGVNKLGNRAIFLGCTSLALAAGGRSSALAGRIYYHGHSCCQFYSLHTRKKHNCEEFYPWVVPGAKEKVWIEPPSI